MTVTKIQWLTVPAPFQVPFQIKMYSIFYLNRARVENCLASPGNSRDTRESLCVHILLDIHGINVRRAFAFIGGHMEKPCLHALGFQGI